MFPGSCVSDLRVSDYNFVLAYTAGYRRYDDLVYNSILIYMPPGVIYGKEKVGSGSIVQAY